MNCSMRSRRRSLFPENPSVIRPVRRSAAIDRIASEFLVPSSRPTPRILVAPDSLKESLDAAAAAEAIERGVRIACPEASVRLVPLADGGEGTLDAMSRAMPEIELRGVAVVGPRPDRPPRRARWGLSADRRRAIVELAEAAGLAGMPAADRDPCETGTHGVGELLEHARGALDTTGSESVEILLALGGSATVDGGIGLARAIGIEILGPSGPVDRPLVGADLESIEGVRIEPELRAKWADVRLRILNDVGNPAWGPDGAARIYGPQKGAGPMAVERLDRGIRHWCHVLESTFGLELDGPGFGAAGGVVLGLVPLLAGAGEDGDAVLRRHLHSGFELVSDLVRLEEKIVAADLVVTSEGRLDGQSFMGKGVGRLLELAESHGVPIVAVPGSVEGLDERLGRRFAEVVSLEETVGVTDARRRPAEAIALSAAEAVGRWCARPG